MTGSTPQTRSPAREKWLFETLQEVPVGSNGKRPPSAPVLDDGVVFLTAWPFGNPLKPGKSFLYAVDAATGKAQWVTNVEGTFVTAPVTANGFVFFAVKDSLSSNRGTLHGIDRADGQVKWTFNAALGFGGGQLLVVGSTLYSARTRACLPWNRLQGSPNGVSARIA